MLYQHPARFLRLSILVSLPVLSQFPLDAQQAGVPYNIVNRLSGKVIDVPTQCVFNSGCILQQWDYDGGPQQQWNLTPGDAKGFYSLINQESQKAIDVPTPACINNNGCQLQQFDSNGAWQQQWTFVPADAAGEFSIVNRLSGKVVDIPTPTCINNNGCQLQQWDSNGAWQQQWQLVPLNSHPSSPPPSGVTILVNGSFDDSPDWMNPSDPEYQAIASTFGNQPIAYRWSPNSEVVPPYVDIFNGAADFANFVNGLNIGAGQSLNIVAHSHGGNVVNIASYNISHPINYLVNLGTPVNWDWHRFMFFLTPRKISVRFPRWQTRCSSRALPRLCNSTPSARTSMTLGSGWIRRRKMSTTRIMALLWMTPPR